VRFDYAEREVDPLPWESGLQVIQEPIIPVRFVGPLQTYLIRSLLDTGASMTLLPRLYLTKLGLVPGERVRLRTAAGDTMSGWGHSIWSCARDERPTVGPPESASSRGSTTWPCSAIWGFSTISR